MKTPMTVSVDIKTQEFIRERAHQQRKSVSRLVDEILREYAGTAATPDPSEIRMHRWEAAALAAYDRLLDKYQDREGRLRGNRFFSRRELAEEAGLYPSEVLRGLRKLEMKGVLMSMMTPDLDLDERGISSGEVEHWGKPLPGVKIRD